jgi:hypothetical protein
MNSTSMLTTNSPSVGGENPTKSLAALTQQMQDLKKRKQLLLQQTKGTTFKWKKIVPKFPTLQEANDILHDTKQP